VNHFKLRQLRHRNIIQLYGYNIEDGEVCNILMEFAPDKDLRHNLAKRENKIFDKWYVKWDLAYQAAIGLEYLHDQKPSIIHRDIKSPNLLLQKSFQQPSGYLVKICDMGMSKYKTNIANSITGKAGTVRWLAPESYYGTYNEASDVYSLGMTFLEIATREYPWPEDYSEQLITEIVRDKKQNPVFSLEDKNFENLIRNCINPDPSKRLTCSKIIECIKLFREEAIEANNLEQQKIAEQMAQEKALEKQEFLQQKQLLQEQIEKQQLLHQQLLLQQQEEAKKQQLLQQQQQQAESLDISGQKSINVTMLAKQMSENSKKQYQVFYGFGSQLTDSMVSQVWQLFPASLTALYLQHNNIGDYGAQLLAQAIKTSCNANLKTLSLHHNQIGDTGATELASSFKLAKLTVVLLHCNKIGDSGAVALAQSLPAQTMTHFSINNNQICEQGYRALAQALQKVKHLTVVDLSNNKVNLLRMKDRPTVNHVSQISY